MATKIRNIVPAIALSCCTAGMVLAFSCTVEAKTGLAPVVVEGTRDPRLAHHVEETLLRELRLHGVNPPRPRDLSLHLGLANPTDPPTTAQCVAAGKSMHLDVIVVYRIELRMGQFRFAAHATMRVVVVETAKEYRYDIERIDSATADNRWRNVVRDARALVTRVFESVRAWEPDLIAVEELFGRDHDEEYAAFLSSGAASRISFADHLYLEADKRMRDGKIVAIVVPAILAAATTVALTAGFKPWTWDDHEDEQCDPACLSVGLGRMMITAGFVLVAVIGYGATIATLALSLLAYSKGKRDVRRLRPLVPNPPEAPEPEFELAFAPWASPAGGGLALDLRF